jgi:hypothetical protein
VEYSLAEDRDLIMNIATAEPSAEITTTQTKSNNGEHYEDEKFYRT